MCRQKENLFTNTILFCDMYLYTEVRFSKFFSLRTHKNIHKVNYETEEKLWTMLGDVN